MNIEISYTQAITRHPKEVKEIIEKLRKGKSIHKNANPEELTWFYHFGLTVDSSKPTDFEYFCEKLGSVKERLLETFNNVSVFLVGKIKKFQMPALFKDEGDSHNLIPSEVKKIYVTIIRKAFHQGRKHSRLSIQERKDLAVKTLIDYFSKKL